MMTYNDVVATGDTSTISDEFVWLIQCEEIQIR